MADGNGTTQSQRAYAEVKRWLIELELPPGAHFTEGELADRLGLSKTPVRDALSWLRRERLVESVARSGYRATAVTLKDARNLFGLRTILESEAAAMAAQHADEIDLAELRRMDELCHASYDPSDRTSISRFLTANRQLHVSIALAGGNDRLVYALEHVLEQLERYFQLALALTSRADEMIHEHTDLLAAVKAGDADAARAIATHQGDTSQRMVVDALLTSDQLSRANLGSLLRDA